MFSDSPNQISNKHKVEWYESPSNNDLTNSGHRQYTQRIPLRTQHEANLRKEAALKSREIKTGDFDLSADDDDDFNNDSLFAKSLMKPLSVDKTSPDLVWKKERTEDNTLASKMLAHLPGKNITQEFLNLSKSVLSEPSTSLANSDIISSSSSMVTPISNRKRSAVFSNLHQESPLATSTPIAPNRMIKKPKLSNIIITPPKITDFNDSFDDETLDDAVFNRFKINNPKIVEKVEAASQVSQKLPDILSTPKISRSRVKASTPLYKKSKSMADDRSLSSRLPSLQPPKQMLPTKQSNTPMRKAKSFANDDDEFNDDDIFTSM